MSYRIEKTGYGYVCPECGGQVLFKTEEELREAGKMCWHDEQNHECNVCGWWTPDPEKECEKEYYTQERFCPPGN